MEHREFDDDRQRGIFTIFLMRQKAKPDLEFERFRRLPALTLTRLMQVLLGKSHFLAMTKQIQKANQEMNLQDSKTQSATTDTTN